jgi:predicted metal-dependent enzyme (double-stranded beta helix superfamily)
LTATPRGATLAKCLRFGRCGLHNTREPIMAYTLANFCSDLSATLKAKGQNGLPDVARKLGELINNPNFVAETFNDDTPIGRRVLWHDPETDAYVLAHVQEGGKTGKPHSHGASWAIYGTASGVTEMTEWKRVNPASEEGAVLEKTRQYALGPGQTRGYASGAIHSTAHPHKAWVVRVTGTDLDAIPRYHFSVKTDKILENA